jgi:hypothetical protein
VGAVSNYVPYIQSMFFAKYFSGGSRPAPAFYHFGILPVFGQKPPVLQVVAIWSIRLPQLDPNYSFMKSTTQLCLLFNGLLNIVKEINIYICLQ